MQLNLNGKGVIVTGGSRGIGLSIAKGFAAEGANVSICARDPSALEAAEKELGVHGSIVHAQSCDVSDSHALEHYLSAACDALGTLNVLVNNPSGFGRGDDEEGWQKSIDVDLMASVRSSWHAAPQIEKAGGGAIIHVSSISGLTHSQRRDAKYPIAQPSQLPRLRARPANDDLQTGDSSNRMGKVWVPSGLSSQTTYRLAG